MKCIYLIGSLRNPEIPNIGNYLRTCGFEVFDSWFAAGPIADDCWQEHEKQRGLTYDQALKDYAATHVFQFDHYHLNRCDISILVMPAGKSGHLEFGYTVGLGKPAFILFDKEPDRWDVMYQFANSVHFNKEDLAIALQPYK